MKLTKKLQVLFSVLMTLMLMGMAEMKALELGFMPGVGSVFMLVAIVALALVPRKEQPFVYRNDEYAETWLREIIKRLWKNNTFLTMATNEDEYVVGGRIVHIPQPGTRPTVVKNRSSLPATAVKRADSDITYSLDEYTTDPFHLPYTEVMEVTYDKLSSLIQDHFGYLIQDVADDILYKWANGMPEANIVYTTGDAAALPVGGDMTGSRLAFKANDLRAARILLNRQNVPYEDRVCVLPSEMMDQLISDLSQTQYRDFSKAMDPQKGVVGSLYGFNIIERSSVITSLADLDAGALVVNDLEASINADDNMGALCYHPMAVSRALGERQIFASNNRPEYYGDLYSSLIRMGGRRRRADNAGIVAIVQAPAVGS